MPSNAVRYVFHDTIIPLFNWKENRMNIRHLYDKCIFPELIGTLA